MELTRMIKTRFDLDVALPGHPAEEDACVALLDAALLDHDGIERVHVVLTGRQALLCVHHHQDVIEAADVEAAAKRAGAEALKRYRHDAVRLAGLHCADCARTIDDVVARLDGVSQVSTTYATEVMRVTYDLQRVDRARIGRELRSLGYRVVDDDQDDGVGDLLASPDPASATSQRAAVATPARGVVPASTSVGPRRAWSAWGSRLPAGLLASILAGAALVVGWGGQRLFGLPFAFALPLYLVAYAAGGIKTARHAFLAARRGRFDIDLLMLVAAAGAAVIGHWAEGALLLFLFSLGHALEHYAMDRSRNAIRALAALAPRTARVREGAFERDVPVEQLRIGDEVVVRPGERLPADGHVLEGGSAVDQAPITGESIPVEKAVGAEVYAGTINGSGSLVVKTSRDPHDSTLARVIRMVEQAQSAKGPSQRFAERFQRVFTPVVLGVTALLIVLPPLFGVPFAVSFLRAMTLLVASSPCALALATPSAVLAGIARAARGGVLIKGGVHLENAGAASVVVFDKTGTLTTGKPVVTDVWLVGDGLPGDGRPGDTLPGGARTAAALEGRNGAARTSALDARAAAGEAMRSFGPVADGVLAIAAAVERKSGHPLAHAMVRAAERRDLRLPETGDLTSVTGKGVTADVEGASVRVGNRALMADASVHLEAETVAALDALEQQGKTSVIVAKGRVALGIVALRDEPRAEAAATVRALEAMGIRHMAMLSGDNQRVAEAIGAQLGISEVHAGLLPEDKVDVVRDLERRYGKVLMVGDGVNDAPAMVAATTGIAMGGAGTDVALETADLVLMGDDLSRLPFALALSRASRRMIVQNLVISLGVIALLVPTAVAGLVTIGIAVVLHEGSTLVVVANALRLLGFKTAPAAMNRAGPPRPGCQRPTT